MGSGIQNRKAIVVGLKGVPWGAEFGSIGATYKIWEKGMVIK